ncbi:MAG: hypothetical protein V3T88_08720 [Nitrosomonadaceae bacterium]
MADTKTTTIAGKSPKQNLRYQRDKDREMVKGIFKFYEVPGGTMTFRFKEYKQDPVERFELKDGETYSIPLGVAKHLNKRGSYPIHAHAVDASGKSVYKIGQKKRRFGFQSLEFIDPEDFSTVDPGIITVENVIK